MVHSETESILFVDCQKNSIEMLMSIASLVLGVCITTGTWQMLFLCILNDNGYLGFRQMRVNNKLSLTEFSGERPDMIWTFQFVFNT